MLFMEATLFSDQAAEVDVEQLVNTIKELFQEKMQP